ncbi:DOMON domain-containing protein [Desulfosediminicola flagellatus]|uniref:DOMON domain-containing protein n=1 Tax=Desulfosediminicola flagellatus TaxID=2569541 RepID=UPI0010AC1CCA|nr:DOMON domain-containing protein [Desulfosediminicola flagellatus]
MLQRMIQSVAIGCFLVFGVASQGIAADYDHTVEAKKMTFSWKIDGENLAGKLTAETDGWVGVGFNPSEKMKDANYVIGYVKKGVVTIVDEFGTTSTGHKNDTKLGGTEDVKVVGGSEEGGITTIEFSIPLKSEDKNDGNIDVTADTTVLLAYGAGRDSLKSKHKFRTTMTINLGTGEVK